jgi:hypothetical protein
MVPTDFPTIQSAIDAANPGDTIKVLPGIYTAIIEHNSVSGNLCNDPACGPDFFNQVQAGAIVTIDAGAGSVIAHNDVFDNDIGIAVGGNSGCCQIHHHKLEDNRFFGITLVDGEHTSAHDKIVGGNVGIAVIALSVDTVGTLVHDKIVDTTTPLQELACCGFTADIVTIP